VFRFSALTYNAHRIHYDRAWVRDVEGYAGLVVHGPLQALLMAEVGGGPLGQGSPSTMSYRLVAPMLEHQGMHVAADRVEVGVGVRVLDGTGRETARATITG
jgi:3-methylfumaryl-CoA hydratase